MSRALLLLDVDGPLNPWAEKPWRRPEGYTTHRLRPAGWEHPRKPSRVWLHPGHGPMLLAFAAERDVELAWATTWQHDANVMIGPAIGLPELLVVTFDRHPRSRAGSFPPWQSSRSGIRWPGWMTDFREKRYVPALAEFQARRTGIPTLLHHVDPRIGLTQRDLDAVGAWMDREVR